MLQVSLRKQVLQWASSTITHCLAVRSGDKDRIIDRKGADAKQSMRWRKPERRAFAGYARRAGAS